MDLRRQGGGRERRRAPGGGGRSGRGWLCAGLALLALAAPSGAAAGAWPFAAGEGQAILTLTLDAADRAFDGERIADEPVSFDKREASLFVEYGLGWDLTFVGRAAYERMSLSTGFGRSAQTGFGETELGLRRTVWRRATQIVSVQGSAILPGQSDNAAALETGEGREGYEARILYGRSLAFAGGQGFAEAQAAWRWRSGPAPDEARLDLTLGWERGPWLGTAQLFATGATGAEHPRRDYDTVKLQAGLARSLGAGTRLQAGVFRTVTGRNIVQETGVFTALWRSF